MLDKETIRAYQEWTPSPALQDKIMSQARQLDAARLQQARPQKNRPLWLRPIPAAALCVCLFLLLGSLAWLRNDALPVTGLTYDGQTLSNRSTALEPVSVAYRESPRAAVYRRDRPVSQPQTLTAHNCVPFSLAWEGDVLLSAGAGAILIYNAETESYVNAGSYASAAGDCRFCWQLPDQPEDAAWLLTAQDGSRTLTLTVSYDRFRGILTARAAITQSDEE